MPNPLFSTKVVWSESATIVYLQGEIDIATAGRLRDAIERQIGPQQTIVLDLSGVAFMDSSCITVLVQARGALAADGGSLVLRNPSALAHRILSLTEVEFILTADDESHPHSDECEARSAM